MSKLLATLVATMFATAAFAQNTPATPPVQPAAGVNTKAEVKNTGPMATTTEKPMASDKAEMRKAKRAKRQMKRVEKVGDKPLN